METTLITNLTVSDICNGFTYSKLEEKGLFGWGGQLIIQPEYQRHYIYGDGKHDADVIYKLLYVFFLVQKLLDSYILNKTKRATGGVLLASKQFKKLPRN